MAIGRTSALMTNGRGSEIRAIVGGRPFRDSETHDLQSLSARGAAGSGGRVAGNSTVQCSSNDGNSMPIGRAAIGIIDACLLSCAHAPAQGSRQPFPLRLVWDGGDVLPAQDFALGLADALLASQQFVLRRPSDQKWLLIRLELPTRTRAGSRVVLSYDLAFWAPGDRFLGRQAGQCDNSRRDRCYGKILVGAKKALTSLKGPQAK